MTVKKDPFLGPFSNLAWASSPAWARTYCVRRQWKCSSAFRPVLFGAAHVLCTRCSFRHPLWSRSQSWDFRNTLCLAVLLSGIFPCLPLLGLYFESHPGAQCGLGYSVPTCLCGFPLLSKISLIERCKCGSVVAERLRALNSNSVSDQHVDSNLQP